jgi:hypothetical protein
MPWRSGAGTATCVLSVTMSTTWLTMAYGKLPLKTSGAMLCIGCLEARLGGKLVASDFPDYPINMGVFPQSTRLRNRLTNSADAANF